jgi:hypothetical protein
MEEESRRYFESGRATFMRNWPYAYALGQKHGSKVAGRFIVMPSKARRETNGSAPVAT